MESEHTQGDAPGGFWWEIIMLTFKHRSVVSFVTIMCLFSMQTIEQEFYNSDRYVVINVPPTFMFKAKIFKPTRLCAVFERVSETSSGD